MLFSISIVGLGIREIVPKGVHSALLAHCQLLYNASGTSTKTFSQHSGRVCLGSHIKAIKLHLLKDRRELLTKLKRLKYAGQNTEFQGYRVDTDLERLLLQSRSSYQPTYRPNYAFVWASLSGVI